MSSVCISPKDFPPASELYLSPRRPPRVQYYSPSPYVMKSSCLACENLPHVLRHSPNLRLRGTLYRCRTKDLPLYIHHINFSSSLPPARTWMTLYICCSNKREKVSEIILLIIRIHRYVCPPSKPHECVSPRRDCANRILKF